MDELDCVRNLARGYFSILAASKEMSSWESSRGEEVYSQKGGEMAKEVKWGEEATRSVVMAWTIKVDFPDTPYSLLGW